MNIPIEVFLKINARPALCYHGSRERPTLASDWVNDHVANSPSFSRHHSNGEAPLGGVPMILIVDDDETISSSLERFLRRADLEVTSSPSGIEALSFLHLRKPNLVILDLHMPHIDGMTMLKVIRQDSSFQDVPILVYTSEISRTVEAEAREAGAQGFLVKGTIGMKAFLSRIRELLGKADPPSRRLRS